MGLSSAHCLPCPQPPSRALCDVPAPGNKHPAVLLMRGTWSQALVSKQKKPSPSQGRRRLQLLLCWVWRRPCEQGLLLPATPSTSPSTAHNHRALIRKDFLLPTRPSSSWPVPRAALFEATSLLLSSGRRLEGNAKKMCRRGSEDSKGSEQGALNQQQCPAPGRTPQLTCMTDLISFGAIYLGQEGRGCSLSAAPAMHCSPC